MPEALVASLAPAYLEVVGTRIRQIRAQRGMSRRILAAASGVSERYLAQLEAGRGNASLLILKALADALHVAIDDLTDPRADTNADYRWLRARLRQASASELNALARELRGADVVPRARHIALIGLRGAGKSTLGQALAKQWSRPFVELVQEIERSAGVAVSAILERGGQLEYRRLELAALNATLARFDNAIIAVGGSLVSEPATFEILLASCCCVWLRTTPQEHMQRVLAQGDRRPMADHRNAMADLKRILDERAALYARADHTLDTAGCSIAQSLAELGALLAPVAGRVSPAAPWKDTLHAR